MLQTPPARPAGLLYCVQPCAPLWQFLLTVLYSLCAQIPTVLHSLAKSQSSKLLSRTACGGQFLGKCHRPCTKSICRVKNAGYTWDWGEHRIGSWVHDNQDTSINRYVIDYDAMEQKNIENGRLRTIRVAWVDHADVPPRWTGQIPQ